MRVDFLYRSDNLVRLQDCVTCIVNVGYDLWTMRVELSLGGWYKDKGVILLNYPRNFSWPPADSNLTPRTRL